MPFRYDFELERVLNLNIPEGSIYEDLSFFIDEIEDYEPDVVVEGLITSEIGSVDLSDNISGAILTSSGNNTTINLDAGPERDRYYLVVNPTVGTVEIVNQDGFPNNLNLPDNKTENMTLFIYTRLNNDKSIISRKLVNTYGVQEGAFFAEDFPALDFSIGDI
jgi:hypothetical protein